MQLSGHKIALYDGVKFPVIDLSGVPIHKSLITIRDLIERAPVPPPHELFDTSFNWSRFILETDLRSAGLVDSTKEYQTPPNLMHELTEFGRFLHLERFNDVNYTNGRRPINYFATMAHLTGLLIKTEKEFEEAQGSYRETIVQTYEDYATRRSQFALEAMDYEATTK